jgi:DNA mismatch repair protein MutL
VVIIDQHALHERVMFETLLERVGRNGPLESQRMLTPAVVDADRGRCSRWTSRWRRCFDRLGIEAEAMGPRSSAVHAFPTFLLIERGSSRARS